MFYSPSLFASHWQQGLQYGKTYESLKSLRYGKLMIMADQDQDGSHIKGLLINFIHHFWPSLLKLNDFLVEFVTPIVKATKGKTEHSFFTLPQFKQWAETTHTKGWKIKYYKGWGEALCLSAIVYFWADLMDKQFLDTSTWVFCLFVIQHLTR
jgi:DNA topoisomerase II